jgi:tRNA nucleotidyltransferase (CCA-adding enzyme)
MSNPKSFIEDPLRIIRLARFNSRFPDFTIDPLTKETILNMSNKKIELENISAERINLEFEKMWKQSTDPSKFFYILRDLGILEIISKEIYNLIYIKENLYHHPEGNTFEHVMIALRKAKELKLDVNSMWMIITHDFGKITTKDGPKHVDHEIDGIPIVESFCKRMRLTDFQTNLCTLFCEQHMRISKIKEMKSFKIATLFDMCKVDHTDKIIKYLAMCSVIDKIGRDKECSWPFTMEEIDSYISAYRSVSGKDVIKLFNSREQDIPQGKEFSHQLNILRGLEISKNRRKI